MIKFNLKKFSVEFNFDNRVFGKLGKYFHKYVLPLSFLFLSFISAYYFWAYYVNGLGLAYNDARSHLDIGRRVVEGLKPGLAQLGSVWLPLDHLLMVPFIWNDWMWHSGFAGAVQNMFAFVATSWVIYLTLKELKVNTVGIIVAIAVFVLNINILYLQSTAMTELLLIFTMTAGCYSLLRWHKSEEILDLIKSGFWIMLATLVRYDGWFLLGFAIMLIAFKTWRKYGYRKTEGIIILFGTLAGLGIVLWFGWNQLIFKDALYFALGPFSAHAQQEALADAGVLPTKFNILLSTKVYLYAMLYNSYTVPALVSLVGFGLLLFDKKLSLDTRISALAFWSPFFFNILALFLGFSVLFVQGISGDTWFNIRYGIMLAPAISIFAGYLAGRSTAFRPLVIGLLSFILFFAFASRDAVTIDDARVGSSQKNVTEVSGYLNKNAKDKEGFILISAASHDAIIFSSGLPMKRFIHEGTGKYWEAATVAPDRWARWIVMRTHDDNDLTYRFVSKSGGLDKYNLVNSYPFADVYELKPEYFNELNTQPVFGRQK